MAKAGLSPNPPQAPGQSTAYQLMSGPQTVSYAGTQSTDPYRSGLQTSFQGQFDPSSSHNFTTYANDSDADVRQAQSLQNQLSQAVTGHDPGADQRALAAQLDAVKSRIGLKNALGSSIAANAGQEGQAEDVIRGNANQALGQGIKNTNQNYNNRGLLYSGMREGADNDVRANVASNMASDLAGTKREYANLKESQEQAYASVGQIQQQQNIDRANQVFDTVNQNNIARAQAYQQLYGGLGQVAGMAYSAYGSPGGTTINGANTANPSSYSNVTSSTLSMPEVGSQYASTGNYGLLGGSR